MIITEIKNEFENCCTCKHNKRVEEKGKIFCRCNIDGHYIGYFKCVCNKIECWEMNKWQKGAKNE